MSTSSVYSKNQTISLTPQIEKRASRQHSITRAAQPVINMAGQAAAPSPNLTPAAKPIKKRISATFVIPTTATSTNVASHTSTSVSHLTPAQKPTEKRPIPLVSTFPITSPSASNTQTIVTTGYTYIGEVVNGCRHGLGTTTYTNGGKYEGQWENDQRHGQGTHTFTDSGKYEGEWRNNMQHGQGTYTFPSGNKYEGQWDKNEREGQGTYIYTNGEKYEGQWHKSKRHGQGTYIFAGGEKYEGQWHKNKPQGQGTHTYADGSKYEGQWCKGLWHGQGRLSSPLHGVIYEGLWQNGDQLLPSESSKPASFTSNTEPTTEKHSDNLRPRNQKSGKEKTTNEKTGQGQDISISRESQEINWGTPVYLSPDDSSDPVFFESATLPTVVSTRTTDEGRKENSDPVSEKAGHHLRAKRPLSQTLKGSQNPAKKRVRQN